jgi:hypothetical protein
MRQRSPGAAVLGDLEDGVDDLAQGILSRSTVAGVRALEQRGQDLPLPICQITGVASMVHWSLPWSGLPCEFPAFARPDSQRSLRTEKRMRVLAIAILLLVSGCLQQSSPTPQPGQVKDCLLGGNAYAQEQPWFPADTAHFFGTRYLKYGPPRIVALALINQRLERAGTHAGGQVALYRVRDRNAYELDPPYAIYVPVAPGCVIQTYLRPHSCQLRFCPTVL